MYIRSKIVKGKRYYQIVETTGQKQKVIRHLGSVEHIKEVFDKVKSTLFKKEVPKNHDDVKVTNLEND